MSQPTQDQDFATIAKSHKSNILSEVLGLLKEQRKWWLLPLLIIVGAFGVLVALGSTGAAPFIYTIF
jgi:hypothetical protein